MPGRLIVIGGGAVGIEMAQAWASLGSQVTVIEALERLLPGEEPFAGGQVREELEQRGLRVHTGVRATAVSSDGDEISVRLESGEKIAGDRLLVAIGRKPLTEGLGLETGGLPGSGYIEVDDHMCVIGARWLYAVGDVNGRSLLTHSGKYQARVAADHILGEAATAQTDALGPPRVVFTDPQVAAVGLTLAAALHAGIVAKPIDVPTGGTAGASFYGRGAAGTTRFVVDVEREVLIGATFVGPDVADFLQAATIAIVGEVPLGTLAHAIAPFPTRSELWLKFLEAYEAERKATLHASSVALKGRLLPARTQPTVARTRSVIESFPTPDADAWTRRTPCVRPTLGAIVAATATSSSALHGGVLLALNSVGLAVPFRVKPSRRLADARSCHTRRRWPVAAAPSSP